MNWKKTNYILHRDLGFLAIGLTLVYAVSGLALNHIHEWNSNYSLEKSTTRIEPLVRFVDSPELAVIPILERLGEEKRYQSIFRPDKDSIQIFVDGRSILCNLRTGVVHFDKAVPRPVLYELNALHLNKPKGVWTWLADIYAVVLGLLAITGGLMIKKRRLLKREGVLMVLGVVVPIVAMVLI